MKKADPRYPFTSEITENGEILYSVPIPVDKPDALITLNAAKNGGVRLISFGDAAPLPVVFIKTTNAAFAYDQRAYLNRQHTRERRYTQRHVFLEDPQQGKEEDEAPSQDENPILSCQETGFEKAEADDLRDYILACVRTRFPKNPLYGQVLELYLKDGLSVREIAEELGIKERAARYFLDCARETAAKYCEDI